MLIQQANLEDIPGVLALLSANHVNNVENKADGFVTTNMTTETSLYIMKLGQLYHTVTETGEEVYIEKQI